MSQKNQNILRRTIIDFFENHEKNQPKKVQHFVDQKISRSWVYKVLAQYLNTGDYQIKPRSGRPRTARTPRNVFTIYATKKFYKIIVQHYFHHL